MADHHRRARLWQMPGGRQVAEVATGGHGKVAFAPDGRSFAVTAETQTRLYEVGGLREQTFAAFHTEQPIQSFALARDGRSLVCEARQPWPNAMAELAAWPLEGREPSVRGGRRVCADLET